VKKTLYTQENNILLSLLREVRQASGLTQAQLADRLGVNQSWVSYYERGSRKLDMLQVRQICRAVDVSLSEFSTRLETMIAEVEDSSSLSS